MKKHLLILSFLLLIVSLLRAQQGKVQIVLNYSPVTCKVQVEYWITNPTQGNGSIQIAVARAAFQWDSTLFTLIKDSSCTTTGLDGTSPPGLNGSDFVSPYRDKDSFSTRSLYGSNFRTLDMIRSTNTCDNVYIIGPQQSKPIALIVLQFRNCNDASTFNFTDTSASNYIADINDGVNDPSPNRKILAIVNKSTRPFDKSGVNCTAGTPILSTSLNNVPVGDTASTLFISQSPLKVIKLKSFEVFKHNNHTEIIWETNGEPGYKEFEIQRKTNAGFITIDYVNPETYISKSDKGIMYNFIDKDNLSPGTSYYRLRLISYQSKESYSEIKAVRISKMLQVLVYPNPGNGKINIVLPDGNGTTDISMTDFSGKLIKTWTGYKIPNIELNGLQKGIYTLLISNRETGEKVSQKITVQ